MLRNLRDLLSLICLPLLVVVLIMWGRSYFVLDRLAFRNAENLDCHLRSDDGHVTWFATTPVFPRQRAPAQLVDADLPSTNVAIKIWESFGFYHEYEYAPAHDLAPAFTRSLTMIPYWFLFLLLSVLPAWRIWAYRRRLAKAVD
jgi:hypothetical protein